MKWYWRCRIGGSYQANLKYRYVGHRFTYLTLTKKKKYRLRGRSSETAKAHRG
eukprot:TRINITY_DN372_c0_g1_i8.p1 TRINITY_DN372_c0_g1~~TRINITY_DN372_c0_g1_i8.p1  ORF type:complete len:53 (+),score=21.54 TRINITY_DN372_c0_g1_i8:1341-1499(+)